MRRETIIFLILALGIVILTFLQINQTFFIYGIGQLLLYCIFGFTLIYSIVRLVRDRRQISTFNKLKPLIIGGVLAGSFFLLSFLVETDGGKRRIITAGFNHDLNFIYVQLFKDKNFRLLNSGPFGGTIYRGTYTLHNDTLRMNSKDLKDLYPTGIFTLGLDSKQKKYFDPIDTAKSMYRLYIYKDFRPGK